MATRVARGFNAYRRRADLREMHWLETEAAAAEGRCRAKMSRRVYESIKDEERAVYRDPHERLDFWRGVETGIEESYRKGKMRLQFDFTENEKAAMIRVLEKYQAAPGHHDEIKIMLELDGCTILSKMEARYLAGIIWPYYSCLSERITKHPGLKEKS